MPFKVYLNGFIILGILLLVLGVVGFLKGAEVLRDPGQPKDSLLPVLYVLGGLVMLVNGWFSIRAYELRCAEEQTAGKETQTIVTNKMQ
ncbi:MAG: hypothetical protein ACYC1M_01585 [Armatimonadota bacterium]